MKLASYPALDTRFLGTETGLTEGPRRRSKIVRRRNSLLSQDTVSELLQLRRPPRPLRKAVLNEPDCSVRGLVPDIGLLRPRLQGNPLEI